MAEENIKSETPKATQPISKLGLLSLVVSAVALGGVGYMFVNTNNETKNTSKLNQAYDDIQNELAKLKTNQVHQQSLLGDVRAQDKTQKQSAKVMQSQLDSLNAQIATPVKDMYLQLSIANIQSAIDYLILAKDVVLFNDDAPKATNLVEIALDKVEASKVASIGAAKRQDIKKSLASFVSKNDVIKEFITIEQQFGELTYLTPENIEVPKANENKYLKYLSSMVEIQDISKDQQLVATEHSKQFIADNLYKALMGLQTAMYVNNDKTLQQAKANLLKILKQYFVQDDKAKKLEHRLSTIEPQDMANLSNSFDGLINDLTKQQNTLLMNDKKVADKDFEQNKQNNDSVADSKQTKTIDKKKV